MRARPGCCSSRLPLPARPPPLPAPQGNTDCITYTIPCVACFALCQDANEINVGGAGGRASVQRAGMCAGKGAAGCWASRRLESRSLPAVSVWAKHAAHAAASLPLLPPPRRAT